MPGPATTGTEATDRPGITLTTEPITGFHPDLAGTAAPGRVQPAPGGLALEEEPLLWPFLGAPPDRLAG